MWARSRLTRPAQEPQPRGAAGRRTPPTQSRVPGDVARERHSGPMARGQAYPPSGARSDRVRIFRLRGRWPPTLQWSSTIPRRPRTLNGSSQRSTEQSALSSRLLDHRRAAVARTSRRFAPITVPAPRWSSVQRGTDLELTRLTRSRQVDQAVELHISPAASGTPFIATLNVPRRTVVVRSRWVT